jgi:uncharacterized membrane protein YtjA (UPF0391 family)
MRRLPAVTLAARNLRESQIQSGQDGVPGAGAMRFGAAIVRGPNWLGHCNPCRSKERLTMLYYAVLFLMIAVAAAVFGFNGLLAGAAGISKILFFVFPVLFAVSALIGVLRRQG